MIMFYLGRSYGRDYFLRKDFKYFSAADIMKVERCLGKWGAVILIFSRFIVGFRSAIALGAGIASYRPVKMFVFSLISYVIFVGLLMYVAMTLVENIDRIEHYFRAYHRILWPIVIGLALAYIVHRYRRLRKKT